jgi:hypothetical protein
MDYGNTHSGHFVLDNSSLLKRCISTVSTVLSISIGEDTSLAKKD